MTPVTIEDRRRELRNLVDEIQSHPEREWTEARQRIAVLREMIVADDARSQPA